MNLTFNISDMDVLLKKILSYHFVFVVGFLPNSLFALETDKISLKAGYSRAIEDLSDINGGSSDALDPGNDGFIINTTAMFNSQYSDYFDTYLDFAWLQYTDRKVIIPGLGIVHSAELEDSAIQPFIGAGVGYAFMYLDDSPSAKLDSIDRNGQSVVFTLQAGADIPLSESLSLDLTARYDMYNIDSSFLQDSGLTIVKDRGALSVLAGLSYHFDSPSRSNYVDEDFDGVTRNLDRCPDTLINVPVNEAGCPQYRFNINLSFNFAKFGIDDIVEHPDFNAAEFLKKNTQYSVRIIGYTDSKGSASFNEKLAKKRAIEAKQYFLDKGVSAERVAILGRGEREALRNSKGEDSDLANRRIKLEFYRTELGAE